MPRAYLYSLKDQPDAVRAAASAHASYWLGLVLPGHVGGPFARQVRRAHHIEVEDLRSDFRVLDRFRWAAK
jgi:hypothetical protein